MQLQVGRYVCDMCGTPIDEPEPLTVEFPEEEFVGLPTGSGINVIFSPVFSFDANEICTGCRVRVLVVALEKLNCSPHNAKTAIE